MTPIGDRPRVGTTVALRQGWVAAVGAVTLGALTAFIVAGTESDYPWLVSRIALVGLALLAMGTAIGSEHAVGLASAPMLGAAVLGATAGGDTAWGRSMMIGCIWYVASELAWASIEQRDGTRRSAAVSNRRLQEVATVVIVGLGVGLAGAAASSLAPERTLVVRALVIGAALIALAGAARHLVGTDPSEKEE